MERDHPHHFERARAMIEPVLVELGFSLAEEHYHQRAFGSAFAVYERRGVTLRLLWDGKDGFLDADYLPVGGVRSPIVWNAPVRSEQTPDEIQRLLDAIRATFSGPRGRAVSRAMTSALNEGAVCCFCGQSLPMAAAAWLTIHPHADSEESQNLCAHRECLRTRVVLDVPLITELVDERKAAKKR